MPYLFEHSTIEINSLDALAKQLKMLEDQPGCQVIRGQLIEGRENQAIRRTSRYRGSQEANFESCSRPWCLIDIDDISLPLRFSDYQNNATEIVAHAVSHLPEEFRSVQCWYQFSSSMGIKKDKIRLHLWYWLARPCSDEEMKAWLAESPVDLRLFNAVQPHFTARPLFLEGAKDPFPERSGFYRPSLTTEVVPPIQVEALRSWSPPRVNRLGLLDGQQIIRDLDTDLIIDGRERFLLICSNRAVKECVQGGAEINLDELTDLTWQYFEAEADLTDQKYSRRDAEVEAGRRMQEHRDGIFDFKGRVSNLILQPVPEPYFKLEPVNVERGIQRLNEELEDFFASLNSGPKKVLKITMGAGKTFQAVEKLKSFLGPANNQSIEIYVPRHDLAEEYVELLAGINANVVHVKPRTGGAKGQFGALCERSDYVEVLEKQGLGVFHRSCRSPEGAQCTHFNSCAYIAQFDEPGIEDDSTNIIRIFVHNYLGLRRNPLQDEPSLVIIDESFIDAMSQVYDLSFREVKSALNSFEHPSLGDNFIDALKRREPLSDFFRRANVGGAYLGGILSRASVIEFEGVRSAAPEGGPRQNLTGLNTLLRQIQRELRNPSADASEAIFVHDKEDGHEVVRVCSRNDLSFENSTPVLMLDATADPHLTQIFFDDEIDFQRIDICQNALVTQVYDRTGSNSFWRQSSAPIDQLITVLNTWADFGEKPLCIGNKELIERLQANADISPDVVLMNFVGLRGSNVAKDCTVAFITGRNEPPPIAIDHKSRGLLWDAQPVLFHDDFGENQNLPLELRGFIYGARSVGIEARVFSDPRVEAVHQQSREAESIQAIARLRLVHNQRRKRVFILSNLPLEMPVDELIKFDDLMPDRLEYEFLKTGNISLTPLGLRKMRPDLSDSDDTSRKMLRRSNITNFKRLKALPSLQRHGLIVIKFKAANKGRKREHQHLFMLDEKAGYIAEGDLQLATSRIPMKHWIELLEAGWGHIEEPVPFYP